MVCFSYSKGWKGNSGKVMLTLLIEYRTPGKTVWHPTGIIGTSNGNSIPDLIAFVKEHEPRLQNCEVQIRKFRRIPGAYNGEAGLLIILEDNIEPAEPVLVH